MISPLYAWIELCKRRPALTAVVDPARIRLDMRAVEIPPTNTWLIVSGAEPPRTTERRTWMGTMRLSAYAAQPFIAQQVIEIAVAEFWDPRVHWKVFRLDSGSQEGAVISIHDVFNLTRGDVPLSGDVWWPFWSVDFGTQVAEEAMAWATT